MGGARVPGSASVGIDGVWGSLPSQPPPDLSRTLIPRIASGLHGPRERQRHLHLPVPAPP